MTSPVFESRSQSDGLLSTIGGIMSANLSTIASEAMTFFDLNNDNCKLEMSCKLGKRMASSMPYLQYFVAQSGSVLVYLFCYFDFCV